MILTWHILTGEYPPHCGGVGDYTEQLAHALARAGCKVHVWCPAVSDKSKKSEGVDIQHVKDFAPKGLWGLGKALKRFDSPRTILVQYAPNAFGLRGLNLFFCFWLLFRSLVHADDVRVMFHEPFYYFARQKLRLNFLALVHRLMALVLLSACRIAYISTPAWERLLRPFALFRRPRFVWLPVPATVACIADAETVTAIRRKVAGDGNESLIVGHFGTYGAHVAPMLAATFRELLEKQMRLKIFCLGRNADTFVTNFNEAHPHLKKHLYSESNLSSAGVSLSLQACDVVVQPYPDGVTSRRTSLMAALVNGVPMVSNQGALSETLWDESGALLLARSPDAKEIASLAAKLLQDKDAQRALAAASKLFYQQQFSMDNSLQILLDAGPVVPDEGGRLHAEA